MLASGLLLLLAVVPALGPAMVGVDGVDAAGYSAQRPDALAALHLLRARRFDELDDWLSDVQAKFEEDPRKEYWPGAALEALGTADPTLEPLLDAWVDAKPDSYMALAARGLHQVAAGWERRGFKWADETPPESFRAMRAAHAVAFPDLDEALRRHPTLTVASMALIRIGMANGLPARFGRQILERALDRCPDCFQVRTAFMVALLPRWGGSYGKMRAFAAESVRRSTNPRMRLLAGYVDWDRCELIMKTSPAAALDACDQALAVGESSLFLESKARALRKLKRLDEALAAIDRADALSPQTRGVLSERVDVLRARHDYDALGRQTAILVELDPVRTAADGDTSFGARALAYQAGVERKAGHVPAAIRLMKRALALDPDRIENLVWLDRVYTGTGQLADALPLWNAYLARHPQDGQAHFERGGTLFRLGRRDEAVREANAACRLGHEEACKLAERLGP